MADPVTIPAIADATGGAFSGREAAALLLMLFGEEEAAGVLSRLEPDQVQTLGEAMFAIANVNEADVNRVFDRFVQKAGTRTTIGYRADQQIEGMMNRALGQDRAANMITRISPSQIKYSTELDQLKWMTPEEISSMIGEEHPQIMALVLSHLTPEAAGEVVQHLPEDVQGDVIFRVATMGSVSPEAIADVKRLLLNYRHAEQTGNGQQSGGTSEAAAIMNNIGKTHEQRIIKALTKRDKNIARTIEEEMFVFADLIELDDKNLGTLLRSVDNEVLIPALKGAEAALSAKFYGCMSSRAAQSIQDEIEELGPVSREDVIAAQKKLTAQARALASDGTIMLGGQGDDFV